MQVPLLINDVDWNNWRPDDHAVLCFLRSDCRLLLIHKKRGLGKGKINGPGGRIEPGESARAAAIRETREEVGLTPIEPRARGELSFLFSSGYGMHVRVFFAERWSGELTETDEARPFWCPFSEIPYDRMWADDRLWLPQALQGHHFRGRFTFDGDTMLDYAIEPSAGGNQSR
ncbi:MAG: 8-oxo-dGTP diphosphatase [Spirochaetaceae bacterium]|nr:MAG: 8-oxo-dGTP diphosphatase [Spirochaetaceae bacterium]